MLGRRAGRGRGWLCWALLPGLLGVALLRVARWVSLLWVALRVSLLRVPLLLRVERAWLALGWTTIGILRSAHPPDGSAGNPSAPRISDEPGIPSIRPVSGR